MAMRFALCAIGGAFAVAIGFSQPPAGTNRAPTFSVASIKPCKDEFTAPYGAGRGAGTGPILVDPERIRIKCLPLDNIILQAYVVYASGQGRSVVPFPSADQWVRGGPGWIGSAYYEIDANPEGPRPAAIMRGPMMQALLEERFKLRVHREAKEIPAYALVLAKGGPKLDVTNERAARRWI